MSVFKDYIRKEYLYSNYPEPVKVNYCPAEPMESSAGLKYRNQLKYSVTIEVVVNDDGNPRLHEVAINFMNDCVYRDVHTLLQKLRFFVYNAELEKARQVIEEIQTAIS